MEPHSGYVLTLANSIIGVSILAMPYCFKQCGIILAILLLLLSSLISRLSCHFLIKSAIMARRKNFEYLAYYIFGGIGKFTVEVGIIGFLIGTSIAFFVVMGDLGPELVTEVIGGNTSGTMRIAILIVLTLFCVLPLGFLRNIDSLTGVTKATIGFYLCLVVKIVIDAIPHVVYGDWVNNVVFWRPAGILQSLPIFSTALACQTQLFEIYHIVQNPSLEKMNQVINSAVNICTIVYLFVGLFGYIAFANAEFSGNILLSFAPSFLTNIIKMGFILSVAFSFPLVIFPCRASLNSLIYKEGIFEGTTDYIPEARFRCLTLMIVFVSLVIGILIPNIEFVLALVGSSIGIMICVLFPVICFISISPKDTNERLLAKLILLVGLVLMVLATYENLHHLNKAHLPAIKKFTSAPETVNNDISNQLAKFNESETLMNVKKDSVKDVDKSFEALDGQNKHKAEPEVDIKPVKDHSWAREVVENPKAKPTVGMEVRHEPPQPMEPFDSLPEIQNKPDVDLKKNVGKNEVIKNANLLYKDLIENEPKEANVIKNNDNVDIEAIRKEDKESLLEQKDAIKDTHLEEHKLLIDKIQKQNEVQEEIVKQQKKLIEVIEKQQEKKEQEDKLQAEIKAVKEIESIALKAIEKISGDIKQDEKVVAKLKKDVLKKLDVNSSENNKPPVKIEELKLMNNMLSNQIKKNNLTNISGELKLKTKNDQPDIKVNNNIDAHVVNSLDSVESEVVKNNLVAENNMSNRINDSQPSRQILKNMLPIPLAASNLKQAQLVNDNKTLPLQTKKADYGHENDSLNIIKRDILAFVSTKSKR